jgi:hypothetical protein
VVARFRDRLRRFFGAGYRVHWDPSAGDIAPPGRWVIQERGHRTGRWQHVWNVQSEEGCWRELGDWAFHRLHSMDMAMVNTAATGHGPSMGKLKSWLDGPRKRRAVAKLVDWNRRYREEILPRAMRRFTAMGHCVRPGGQDPEEAIRMAAIGHPGSEREIQRLEVENLAIQGQGIIPVSGRHVFPSLSTPDLPVHAGNARKGRRRKGRI